MIRRLPVLLAGLGLAALMLAACAPAATPAPQVTQPAGDTPVTQAPAAESSRAPAPTSAPEPTRPDAGAVRTEAPTLIPPTATAPGQPPTQSASPTAAAEARVVEVEWPPRLRLGDSDSVRLSLIPSAGGYTVTTEFPDNQVITQTVAVPRPGGYELFGLARLEGVGFDLAPAAEQVLPLPPGEPVTWRWTITPRAAGRHRLTLDVRLRWVGPAGVREAQLYSRALTIQVASFLGLTTGQAMWLGILGLMTGGGVSVAALTFRLKPRPAGPQPNPALSVEPPPGLAIAADERALLQTLFRRYARLVIENEFRSGYSGARTLLALPIRADGRADAHTIVKLGERRAIELEHRNYETYVKDTLPPMTARIQDEPVFLSPATAYAPRGEGRGGGGAALRYTFIAEPGQRPASLREALLKNPDPALLLKLFETFGPNWWLQRRAHTFRLAQEYDRLLPAHVVLEPAAGAPAASLGPATGPAALRVKVGDLVRVGRFPETELRQDGKSLSLMGQPQPGEPPLRVRWLSVRPPDGAVARVVATRGTLLREAVAGLDLLGLPDPLPRLPAWLAETVAGSLSTIHGDLNLENVLVGPGGFVWLIDFARTRDGHPLFDFAHLEAEVIAHILAPQIAAAQDYLELWSRVDSDQRSAISPQPLALLVALHQLAARCLANPAQPREYHLALCLACLGALKHSNLDRHARHLLYLTAALVGRAL